MSFNAKNKKKIRGVEMKNMEMHVKGYRKLFTHIN